MVIKTISDYLNTKGIKHNCYDTHIVLKLGMYDVYIRFFEIQPYDLDDPISGCRESDRFYNLSIADPELLPKIVALYDC